MYRDNFFRELIVDNFAGGGGASLGIELATGRPVDIAINHDPDAIAMHDVNHPYTMHYIEDVFAVNPVEITGGRPVHLGQTVYAAIHPLFTGTKPFVQEWQVCGIQFDGDKFYAVNRDYGIFEVGSNYCKLTKEEAERALGQEVRL